MKTMKSLLFSVCLLTISNNYANNADQHILLKSPIVEFVDGKSIGIDATVIRLMLQVRAEIKKILFGKRSSNGHFEGHFNYEGHMCSVRQLSTLENKYELEFKQKEAEYVKNLPSDTQKLEELRSSYHKLKHKMNVVFELTKKEFRNKITPFAKNSRGAKHQMLMLIEESCVKRNRNNCLLLKWADADEQNEMYFFDQQVLSFRDLDQFCIDLANFLGDLMHSCPKAMAQYEQAKKVWDAQHKA
ncbi:MAG: hypothetical protein P4L31_06300 [Candidatus Babeliales bacterium]|nr:hypothetical protein [Candidatus Babeliales bacterium]